MGFCTIYVIPQLILLFFQMIRYNSNSLRHSMKRKKMNGSLVCSAIIYSILVILFCLVFISF